MTMPELIDAGTSLATSNCSVHALFHFVRTVPIRSAAIRERSLAESTKTNTSGLGES